MLGNRLAHGRHVAERHQRRLRWEQGSFNYEKWNSLCHFEVRGKRVPYETWLRHSLGIWRKTRCFCSSCCGNPRHFYHNGKGGLTLQERRRNQRERY